MPVGRVRPPTSHPICCSVPTKFIGQYIPFGRVGKPAEECRPFFNLVLPSTPMHLMDYILYADRIEGNELDAFGVILNKITSENDFMP